MDKLFLLCKEGIASSAIEEFHDHIQSVNRFMIGAIITTEPVINAIRKELRRISPGLKVTNSEIEKIALTEVFKRDVVEGEPFKNAQKQLIKAVKRTQPKPITPSNKGNNNPNYTSE